MSDDGTESLGTHCCYQTSCDGCGASRTTNVPSGAIGMEMVCVPTATETWREVHVACRKFDGVHIDDSVMVRNSSDILPVTSPSASLNSCCSVVVLYYVSLISR